MSDAADALGMGPAIAVVDADDLHPLDGMTVWEMDSPAYDELQTIYADEGAQPWGDAVLGVRAPQSGAVSEWLVYFNHDCIARCATQADALARWHAQEARCTARVA